MVNSTNVSTISHSNYAGTYVGQEKINDLKVRVNNLNKEALHLLHELRGNMANDDVSHDETIPVNDALEHLKVYG